MFDIGFFELTIVAIVALLVVGPERLPKMARTAGLWLGKTRTIINNVKHEIDQELKTDELQRILTEQAKLPELETIVETATQKIDSINAAATKLQINK